MTSILKKSGIRNLFTASLLLLIPFYSFLQSGTIDPTFNTLDTGLGNGDLSNATIYISAVQPNGKIIVGGYFTMMNGVTQNKIARLNADGTNDPTFNTGTGPDGTVHAIAVQADGSILIGGDFYNVNGATRNKIARLTPTGAVDANFNPGADSRVRGIHVQPDGKILVNGNFLTIAGVSRSYIARLNNNGTIDATFNAAAGTNSDPNTLILQPDGKIFIGGYFTTVNGVSMNKIARLNANGTLDATFNPGTGIDAQVYSSALQPDGKILIGGDFLTVNGTSKKRIARLNSDGSLDPSFTSGVLITDVSGMSGIVYTISVQADGKIIVGGDFMGSGTSYQHFLRYNADGSLDATMNPMITPNEIVRSSNILSNGKILIVGEFQSINQTTHNRIAVINPDGTLDGAFASGSGANDDVRAIAVQTDGKIVAGGNFMYFNGEVHQKIVRLETNGSVDPGFMAQVGTSVGHFIYAIAIQPDGKILVGGNFGSVNGFGINNLARLNTDGSVDTTFDIGFGFVSEISSIALQPDGKILVGGVFTVFDGDYVYSRIVRLNTDGSRDLTFNVSCTSGEVYEIKKIQLQPDGKILIAGDFSSISGVTRNHIARLNADGSLDPTFNPGSGANDDIRTLYLQADGKILIGGYFTTINGVSKNRIARLNTNGTLDATFGGTGANNSVITLDVQSDGKIIVGGTFTTMNGVTKNSITRLNTDGSIDPTFVGIGANEFIFCDAIQNNGNILIGGGFTAYNGTGKNRLARIINCAPISTTLNEVSCDSFILNGQTYTVSGTYTQTIPLAFGCDSIIHLNLTITNSTSGTDTYTTCDSLTWMDGITYYSSTNTPSFTLTNAAGCDSIITLDLTIIPSLPLTIENSFSMPSDANSCVGEVAITVSGNADFELDFDNGSQVVTSNGYSLVSGLCAGIHDLHVTDNCGDTLSTTIVIPVDSNYVFNNPVIDSLAQDSLGVTLTNCDIFYNGIDTAYIDSIWANGNTVNVIWNIVDSNGSNFDTTSYVLNNGNGVYWLQLSVFCPNKSVGEYFTVTEAIYFNDGHVSTAGLADVVGTIFEIYPNPTNDQVHINFSGSDAELTVYDLQGKVVLKDRVQNQEIISLQNFERGVYLFDFKNSNGHSVQRVVKQ
jgi:uncharacterized delta-60 repeat protein